MARNRNLDIIRGVTIIIIVVYHVYAIADMYGYGPRIYIPVLTQLLMYGGEIGVTLFFMMSGYGIYCSLMHSEEKDGKILYMPYMKRRFKRIAPQYYVSLAIVLCLTEQASLLATYGCKHVVTHLLFVHNLLPDTHGSINGVLWTMGTIVQFYIISVLLYKCVRKNSVISLLVSVIVTVGCKYILFHLIGVEQYFVYGRQLITALDNFVIGMVLAKYISQNDGREIKVVKGWLCFAGAAIVLAAYIFISGKRWNIYQDSLIGWCWHSVLAIILAFVILGFSKINIRHDTVLARGIHYLADVQYGIYIWHLLIIQRLLASSPLIVAIAKQSFLAVTVVLLLISIAAGIVSTKCIDGKGLIKQ